jgi:outer membrane protein assembly factor BamB/HEAT repeat protein
MRVRGATRPRCAWAGLICLLLGCWSAGIAAASQQAAPHADPANPVLFRGLTARVWADRLVGSDRAARREAYRQLVEGQQAAVPVLGALLRSPDERVRKRADAALGRIPAAVPVLIKLVGDANADTRYHAISVLGDLAPDSAPAVGVLAEALADRDALVVIEAAWALASLRGHAEPAVDRLIKALFHVDIQVRINAAGALGAIGPPAARACDALVRALGDFDPAVRRCAAEGLAAIGPGAASAVPRLTQSLKDENLYVRLFAVGALGSIGKAGSPAVAALQNTAKEPALAAEAAWALAKIKGTPPATTQPQQIDATPAPTSLPAARSDAWPMLGRTSARNAVSQGQELPESWDLSTGRNVRWSVELGVQTYGSPVVADGMVFVGTDNDVVRDPAVFDTCGVMLAFRASDGEFLWQDTAPALERGLDEFLLPATTCAPFVEGERLYYVTAQAQLRCLDTLGFRDGENDGWRDERNTHENAADLVWELDLGARLGVFPHEAPNCSVTAVGNVLLVCTSNGVDESHVNVPAPRAPSFLGVDKRTGAIVWKRVGPGQNILHGQWSSPAVAEVNGRTLAFFGGGDGWLYALEALTGREVWRYDGNPKNAVWRTGRGAHDEPIRNAIIACPVVHQGRVYLAMGQDPDHGAGPGRLHAIDPGGRGDVTTTRRVWEYTDIGRVIGTPVVFDDLLFAADTGGLLHCMDRASGKRVWVHDVGAAVWGCLIVIDGRLYVGDEDGVMTVMRAGRERKVLTRIELNAPLWASPAVAEGVLYVATSRRLYALAQGE